MDSLQMGEKKLQSRVRVPPNLTKQHISDLNGNVSNYDRKESAHVKQTA